MTEDSNNDADVFVYMGEEVSVVSSNIIRARVHPSVTELSSFFKDRRRLEEVELCDGLVYIGRHAFDGCRELRRVNIPSTVRVINESAFSSCRKLVDVELNEGIMNICEGAFASCRSLNRINLPSTVQTIEEYAFEDCKSMFSIEISDVTYVGEKVFNRCKSLRNIAISFDVIIADENTFRQCTDLKQLFGTQERIIDALVRRFDNLPIHKMIYYQSYNNTTSDQLRIATDSRTQQSSSGNQRDCMGMTPLHILACSTIQIIELYRVLIEQYPKNLVTKDGWRAVPLLYAVWGQAPDDIIQFLVGSHQSIYPNCKLNWTSMIRTLFRASAPLEVIQKLLTIHEESFPGQSINWDRVFERLTSPRKKHSLASKNTVRQLVKYSIAERISKIGIKLWRDEMTSLMNTDISKDTLLQVWLDGFRSKLVKYEKEYSNLKEATTILELVLWKKNMNDLVGEHACIKEMTNIENSNDREQYRINCGADIVIHHILPYLMPASCPTDDVTPHPISTTGPAETGSHFGNFVFQGYDQPLNYQMSGPTSGVIQSSSGGTSNIWGGVEWR